MLNAVSRVKNFSMSRVANYHKAREIREKLETIVWDGPKRSGAFDDYVATFVKAFRDMEEIREPHDRV